LWHFGDLSNFGDRKLMPIEQCSQPDAVWIREETQNINRFCQIIHQPILI